MKKICISFFCTSLILISFIWHPFKPMNQFYIYKLINYKMDATYQQYLLLKKNTDDTIYDDMDIRGPFTSIVEAHQTSLEKQNDAYYGELRYLPIVRKNHAN